METKKAFTLIELLIVIAIIGILASVILVNLGSARRKAQAKAAMRSLQSAATAVNACMVFGNEDSINRGAASAGWGNNITFTPGTTAICNDGSNAIWPILPSGWSYSAFYTSTSTTNRRWYWIEATNNDNSQYIVCHNGTLVVFTGAWGKNLNGVDVFGSGTSKCEITGN